MKPQLVTAHPHVAENTGRVAIMHGPLVYCAEAIDNPHIDLRDVELSPNSPINARHDSSLLNSVTKLTTRALVNAPDSHRALYAPQSPSRRDGHETDVTFIPYYAWANRAAGRMQVWHRVQSS
jgi:DUF1680 family protein